MTSTGGKCPDTISLSFLSSPPAKSAGWIRRIRDYPAPRDYPSYSRDYDRYYDPRDRYYDERDL